MIQHIKSTHSYNIDNYFKKLSSQCDTRVDYYLIDPQGTIEKTSYATDLNFNFPKRAPNAWKMLEKLKPGEDFIISAISIETKTSKLRQYSYYKFSDGYILEVGILLQRVHELLNDYVKKIKTFPFVGNIDILYRINGNKYKSLLNAKFAVRDFPVSKSDRIFYQKKLSNTKRILYVGLKDPAFDFYVYGIVTIDFSFVYNSIYFVGYLIIFIFLLFGFLIFFFTIANTKSVLSIMRNISSKLKNSEYLSKPIEKTYIKEFNDFIDAHNSLVNNLNDSLQEQESLNDSLISSLQKLQIEKKRFEELFMNIPNSAIRVRAIFNSDITRNKISDLVILNLNKKIINVLKIEDDIIGKSLKEVSEDPKEFSALMDMYQAVFNKKTPFDFNFRNRWYRVYSHLEEEDIAVVIFTDIDEIKKLQLNLQDSERRLKIAVNAADEAIWEYNYKTDRATLSDKAWIMLGYEPKLEPQSMLFWKTLMHPIDRKRFIRIEKKISDGEIDYFKTLIRFKTKNGYYKWIEIIGEVVEKDSNGKPIKVIGIRRDVDKKKRADDLVKEAERRYRKLIDNSINAIAVYEPINNGKDFRFLDINDRACKIEGLKKDQVIGKTLTELFPYAVEKGFLQILQRVNTTGVSQSLLLHYFDDKGVENWRDNYIYKLPSGEIVAVYQDVSQEMINRKTINLLSSALEASKNIIYIADDKCNVLWVNSEFEKITGLSLKDLKGKNIWSIYDLPKEKVKDIYESLNNTDLWKGELQLKDKDGKLYWERLFMTAIRENGKVVNIVKVGEDITKEKEMEKKLEEYATIDELTKVLNRRAGYMLLEKEAKKAVRNKTPLTVAFVDMDHLKKINDTFGHEKGDEMIKKMVEICESSMRDTDTIMRIGGDEFVLIFPESTISDVKIVFESRIERKIKEFNEINKSIIPLSISYGFAQYDDFDRRFDIEELLNRADDLMYEMKKEKKVSRE